MIKVHQHTSNFTTVRILPATELLSPKNNGKMDKSSPPPQKARNDIKIKVVIGSWFTAAPQRALALVEFILSRQLFQWKKKSFYIEAIIYANRKCFVWFFYCEFVFGVIKFASFVCLENIAYGAVDGSTHCTPNAAGSSCRGTNTINSLLWEMRN